MVQQDEHSNKSQQGNKGTSRRKQRLRSDIPDIVIGRLPIYLRALARLQHEGREITSSHELGQRLGISSAQIRKDLSHFGEFGKQGTGYNVAVLSNALEEILGLNGDWEVALVGIGDLGRAIAHYGGFSNRGFRITLLFDKDESKVGDKVGQLDILPYDKLKESITAAHIEIAMIATPAEAAQAIADDLIDAGIKAILNYAPITITVPEGVHVQYIDPVIHLQRMVYYLD